MRRIKIGLIVALVPALLIAWLFVTVDERENVRAVSTLRFLGVEMASFVQEEGKYPDDLGVLIDRISNASPELAERIAAAEKKGIITYFPPKTPGKAENDTVLIAFNLGNRSVVWLAGNVSEIRQQK